MAPAIKAPKSAPKAPAALTGKVKTFRLVKGELVATRLSSAALARQREKVSARYSETSGKDLSLARMIKRATAASKRK